MPQAVFLPYLKQMGYLDGITMTICFVGSRKLTEQDDLGKSNWGYFVPNLKVYGFDADAEACEEANTLAQSFPWQEEHFPVALSAEEGEKTLYVTKNPMCSSLYPPNEHFAQRIIAGGMPSEKYRGRLIDYMQLDFTVELTTKTLDSVFLEKGIAEVDLLKTDVQGADLDVLRGALGLLEDSILGVLTEVCFQPLYIGQPLFAEVDQFLRQQYFSLFYLDKAPRMRFASPIIPPIEHQQLIWGDALYLRDPLQKGYSARFLHPEKLLKLACIADVHGACDFSLELLEYLTINYGQEPRWNMTSAIREAFGQFPEAVKAGLDNLSIIKRLNAAHSKTHLQ